MVLFFEEEIKFQLKEKLILKRWIKETCHQYQKNVGSINYIFCSDEFILTVNKDYLNHDFYTDIITFDQSDKENTIDGEIYISIERVADNAKELNITFETELHRVIIHGILHLIGFGDKTKEEATKMRELENSCLQKII